VDFPSTPRHFDPKSQKMHDGTVVDMDVDLDSARQAGESPAVYLTRMVEKYVPKK